MKQKLNVLIIDKHPIIIDYFQKALYFLSLNHDNLSLKIETALDCKSANNKIENAINTTHFDLVFLDIDLPLLECDNYLSGEEIALEIRRYFKNAKILVCTAYKDNYHLNTILRQINPEGFILKEDVSYNELVDAVHCIVLDPPYYSRKVIKLLRQQFANDFILDRLDRQLLYQLSLGTKTKDLPTVLHLSMAGVERRKRRLKKLFKAQKKEDMALVKLAKQRGFI